MSYHRPLSCYSPLSCFTREASYLARQTELPRLEKTSAETSALGRISSWYFCTILKRAHGGRCFSRFHIKIHQSN